MVKGKGKNLYKAFTSFKGPINKE